MFNLCHAQLWNIVKWIFGVAKNHFAILHEGNDFGARKQADLITAFIIVFNFICIFGDEDVQCYPKRWKDVNFDGLTAPTVNEDSGDEGELGGHISIAERCEAENQMDPIACSMWDDY